MHGSSSALANLLTSDFVTLGYMLRCFAIYLGCTMVTSERSSNVTILPVYEGRQERLGYSFCPVKLVPAADIVKAI